MEKQTTITQQVKAILDVCDVMTLYIKAAERNGVPSGHLYAQVMGVIDLDQYMLLVDILKESGKVTERHHVLYWVQM